jgi:hypothetical protein
MSDSNIYEPIDATNEVAGASAKHERKAGSFQYASGAKPLGGFTIRRGVGQGGFGEIYYATSDAGKEVALKLIRRNLDVELRGMRQCLNLKSPHLLSLFDIRQDSHGDTWVVMEFMSGQSLEDVLGEHPHGLPPVEVSHWFQGIASGVACLHDHGIVHRDLKPANIFSDGGVVKVGDYGLSKFISCSRRSGHTESIGTVHYMAPEVANGRYGKELDIYAMGVILFELVTGRVPFEGESVGEILMKHLTTTADISQVAEPYRSVIGKALEKDPDKRYRSVHEMLTALGYPTAAPAAAVNPQPVNTNPAGANPAGPQPTIVIAEMAGHGSDTVDRDPIADFAGQHWRQMRCAWRSANHPWPVKVLIITAIVVALCVTGHVIIPALLTSLFLYGMYRFIRLIAGGFSAKPQAAYMNAPYGQPAAFAHTRPWQARRRGGAEAAMIVKPLITRTADLVGSMLGAAFVSAAMTFVAVVVETYKGTVPEPQQAAWMMLVSLGGTWIVLAFAKLWEGYRGEPILRRFVMMCLGFGYGLVAFITSQFFMLHWTQDPKAPHLPATLYDHGQPQAMAFMAAFAALFFLLRWWLHADPMRQSRFSFITLILTVLIAAVVAQVLWFPAAPLIWAAASMSVAVQLCSPWVPLHQRLRPQRKTVL